MCKVDPDFKILSELLVADLGRVNHLSMCKVDLHFKILSDLLAGNLGGDQSSFHVQGRS